MNKRTHIAYSALMTIFLVTIVYLGLQLNILQSKVLELRTEIASGVDINQIKTGMASLQTAIDSQQQTLMMMSARMDDLPENIEAQMATRFLPRPIASLSKTLYMTNATSDAIYARAQTPEILAWLTSNQYFLDDVLKQSLTLDYDRYRKKVVVTDIAENSIYAQMGLEVGDYILSINGQTINNGDVLRQTLIQPEDQYVKIMRDKDTIDLNVLYRNTNTVALDVTADEFKRQIAALIEGDVVTSASKGIKINEAENAQNVLAKVVQPEDVITRINGAPVDTASVKQALTEFKDEVLQIDLIRNGQTQNVDIAFESPVLNTQQY